MCVEPSGAEAPAPNLRPYVSLFYDTLSGNGLAKETSTSNSVKEFMIQT